MIAAAQYLVYLLVGGFYIFAITFFISVGFDAPAEATIRTMALLFPPLFLAGYASGLSFFFPRVAAIAGILLVLPFFYIGFYGGTDDFFFTVIVAPASVAVLISIFALLRSKTSLWAMQEQTNGKVLIVVFAVVPTLLATLLIASTIILLSGFLRTT